MPIQPYSYVSPEAATHNPQTGNTATVPQSRRSPRSPQRSSIVLRYPSPVVLSRGDIPNSSFFDSAITQEIRGGIVTYRPANQYEHLQQRREVITRPIDEAPPASLAEMQDTLRRASRRLAIEEARPAAREFIRERQQPLLQGIDPNSEVHTRHWRQQRYSHEESETASEASRGPAITEMLSRASVANPMAAELRRNSYGLRQANIPTQTTTVQTTVHSAARLYNIRRLLWDARDYDPASPLTEPPSQHSLQRVEGSSRNGIPHMLGPDVWRRLSTFNRNVQPPTLTESRRTWIMYYIHLHCQLTPQTSPMLQRLYGLTVQVLNNDARARMMAAFGVTTPERVQPAGYDSHQNPVKKHWRIVRVPPGIVSDGTVEDDGDVVVQGQRRRVQIPVMDIAPRYHHYPTDYHNEIAGHTIESGPALEELDMGRPILRDQETRDFEWWVPPPLNWSDPHLLFRSWPHPRTPPTNDTSRQSATTSAPMETFNADPQDVDENAGLRQWSHANRSEYERSRGMIGSRSFR